MEKKNIITVQMEESFYNKVMGNVEGSGGSGGGSDDAEYISFKGVNINELHLVITTLSLSVRLELEQGGVTAKVVVPAYAYAKQFSEQVPSAVKFNRNEKMNTITGMDGSGNPIIQSATAIEYLGLMGQTAVDELNSLPRISEEEFYSL